MRRAILGSAAGLVSLSLAAAPAAAPVRHAAGPVTLKKVRFATSWRESHFLSGRLILVGKATKPMTFNLGWFAKTLLSKRKPAFGASGPI